MVATRYFIGALSLITLFFQRAHAEARNKIKFLLNYYDQKGNQGHQVYDVTPTEELSVFEPMLFVAHQVDENTDLSAHIVFDTWTAASDTKLDANTGASGGGGIKGQSRTSGQIAYAKDLRSWRWSTRFGLSSEYDYRSLNFGGELAWSLAQDNFVLSLSPQLFLDQARDFSIEDQKVRDYQGRTIYSLDISGSQLLTPSDSIQFGYTIIGMNGMLNNITNTVRVDDLTADPLKRTGERLPSSRLRHALSSKWVHGFSDVIATHLSYRYYDDDWGVRAHTADIGPRFSFNDDRGLISFNYRYHEQAATKYFTHGLPTSREFMTSDSDLGSFTSHRYGSTFSYELEDQNLYGHQIEGIEWSAGLHRLTRSNDLKATIIQLGLSGQF